MTCRHEVAPATPAEILAWVERQRSLALPGFEPTVKVPLGVLERLAQVAVASAQAMEALGCMEDLTEEERAALDLLRRSTR